MWNRNLFKELVSKIVKDGGIFLGKRVRTRVELYEILAENLYVAPETIKGWSRHNSNGPGDEETLRRLESLLGTKLTTNEEKEILTVNQYNQSYSDFVKTNIKECYFVVANYIRTCDLEDEDKYEKMMAELSDYECFVPEQIYEGIKNFAEEKLEPIVYEGDEYFIDCFSPEIGEFKGETFHIKDDMVDKFAIIYYLKIAELDVAFQKFGKEKIYPVIMR